ncbi:MAG: DUF5665 domain-containing protein [Clostridia bacterium]|jgi:hypothetical protein
MLGEIINVFNGVRKGLLKKNGNAAVNVWVTLKQSDRRLAMAKSNSSEEKLSRKIDELAIAMEKMKIAEYTKYLANTRKMLLDNFLAGLARGFGMAIGFTILGAIALYFLQRIAYEKLPIIGDFIAEIVKIVKDHL